jgi:hypothetical protein
MKVGDLVVFSLASSSKKIKHMGVVVDYEPATESVCIRWNDGVETNVRAWAILRDESHKVFST